MKTLRFNSLSLNSIVFQKKYFICRPGGFFLAILIYGGILNPIRKSFFSDSYLFLQFQRAKDICNL